jgi:hypothetical protein
MLPKIVTNVFTLVGFKHNSSVLLFLGSAPSAPLSAP